MKATISRDAAEENAKLFFKNTAANEVPIEEVYVAADRMGYTDEQNRTWLGNKLWAMGPYNLVKRNYGVRKGKKRLKSLSLTDDGLKALGRDKAQGSFQTVLPVNQAKTVDAVAVITDANGTRYVTLQYVTDVVDEFNRQNPSWEIEIVPKRVRKGEAAVNR